MALLSAELRNAAGRPAREGGGPAAARGLRLAVRCGAARRAFQGANRGQRPGLRLRLPALQGRPRLGPRDDRRARGRGARLSEAAAASEGGMRGEEATRARAAAKSMDHERKRFWAFRSSALLQISLP